MFTYEKKIGTEDKDRGKGTREGGRLVAIEVESYGEPNEYGIETKESAARQKV
jgi:hypothetical protein